MSKLKTFNISAEVKVEASVEIRAASLEEALQRARELKVTDFVEATSGCFDDYNDFEIRSVYKL